MKRFSFDEKTGFATIGAGWGLGLMYHKLWNATKVLVAASTCSSVFVGRHILRGGTGVAARKYGLTAHNVVGMAMVDAIAGIASLNDADTKSAN